MSMNLKGSGDPKDIKVIEIKFLRGPNIHALFPVMEAEVDLGSWVDTPSDPEFADKLSSLLPELEAHKCSYEEPGGFIKRLNEGTYPAHIIEHCVIAIQNKFGCSVSFGKARNINGSRYMIVTDYEVEKVASSALRFCVDMLNNMLHDEMSWEELESDVKQSLDSMKRSALLEERMGPSTSAIITAAKERNIPYRRILPKYSLFYLGWGVNKKAIWGPVTSLTPSIGADLVQDKNLCKKVLEDHGLTVPRGRVVTRVDSAVKYADMIGYPVVLKPESGHHGKGVLVDLRDGKEVKKAFKIASRESSDILVEEHIKGHDYRFLVVDNKVVAVAKRIPAHVVGDGKSTVEELIEEVNKDPRRANGHVSSLTRIEISDVERSYLKRHGSGLNKVPKEGETVYLRGGANLSTGGIAEDFTEKVHPSFRVQIERASRALDMDLVGIDIICEDITVPEDQTEWAIIEANASPGLRMHLSPNVGDPIPVGKHIVDHLYPEGDGRIPVIAVTGTNGKTTTCRIIDWIIRSRGHRTGLAVTGGIYIKGQKVIEGDTTGPWSAQKVLQDSSVEYAVLETARGGILRRGMGFDRCSVSVVTNIGEDHIGVDEISGVEDIFWIKSVVVEATEKNGHCVINANDDFAERLLERAKGKPVLFAVEENEITDRFIESGDKVFLKEGDDLVMYSGGKKERIVSVHEVNYLRGGVRMMVENTLAAVAAARCSGISGEAIADALKSFRSTERTNPGRLNMYGWDGRKILLDYAHNPDALRSLGEYVSTMDCDRKTIVFAGVGDRRDEDLVKSGEVISGGFDDIIITEYPGQRRGRKAGEVSSLIFQGVESNRGDAIVIEDMDEAVSHALQASKEGDLIALVDLDYTYEQLCKITDAITEGPNQKPKEVKSPHRVQL